MSEKVPHIQIPVWLSKRHEITSTSKILYGWLVGYSRKHNRAFPFRSTLAENMGRCERTVDRAVKELEKFSLVHVTRRGKKLSNVYYLLDHEWMEKSESTFVSTPPVDNPHSESTFLSEKGGGESTFVSTPHQHIIRLIDNIIEEPFKNEFEEWWEVYPRKQNKDKAYVQFCEARKKVGFEGLLYKAKSYARHRDRIVAAAIGKDYNSNQDLYTKMPNNWLMGACWLEDYGRDEVTKPKMTVTVPSLVKMHRERSPYDTFEPRTNNESREIVASGLSELRKELITSENNRRIAA